MADCRISVIVCSYSDDRFDLLLASIDSIARQTVPAHEVIVVVDHNGLLAQRVRSAGKHISVIESSEPKGLSGARNAGVNAAAGDIVAFLDDDATAETDWLEKLAEPYQDPSVVGVGGGASPRWESRRPIWLPAEFYWVIGCTWNGLPRVRSETRNLMGCNMSFRREACIEVGGFASELFFADRAIVNDETEFCVRMIQRRPENKLLFLPEVVVRHFVPTGRVSVKFFLKRCWREGRAKRITVKLVGSSVALSRERRHLVSVIPRAGLVAVGEALRGHLPALTRLPALVAGTAVTVGAFVLPPRRASHP